ncbi:Cna B-type domain-containing protein, partial [Methanobrevibacter thaueri]|uniref:Cna B-type domain-containing protein n=1 Tax=Methanobrevibacter thaueri TaxID=190975 RepID=UPI000E30139D
NTHDVELVNVTVVKVWTDNGNQDGVRPANVTVLLFADDVNILNVTLSDSNNWTHTFVGLDKFRDNGTEIVYRVNETEVRNYTAVIVSDGNGNWTINNTHDVELVNVTVVKVWTDNGNQDGVRPANVTVLLFADDVNILNVTLSDSNNWTHTFVGLDKFRDNGTEIVYRVNETEVRNYTAIITRDNNNFLINNTHDVELVNVTVVKVWTDNGNQDGVRPANVTVLLFADDVNIMN